MVPKLTTNGISLMVRAMGGEGITFTKIAIGNGEAPADYTELTKLQNELVSMEISELVTEDQYVIIKATMSNSDFDAGFYWTELGVYAQDPDGGDDVLYAYAHYVITGDEAATYIPASDSSLVEITHSVHVFVGELENVTALLMKHSEFASAADLKAHTENIENPHKVTKAQVGLGLIVNALPENQRPKFTAAASAYTYNSKTNRYTFTNIFSGESVGNMLRKIWTFINLMIGHLNTTNPHRVTAAQAGAAARSHTHAATDIVKGTLGLDRGGTGGTNAKEARVSLGIQAGSGGIIGTAGEEVTKTIAFSSEFETTPYVVLTPMTDMHSADVYLSVKEVTRTEFVVRIYSETLNPVINFNWIAVQ